MTDPSGDICIKNSSIKDSAICFGPMACRIVFYVIVRGRTNEEALVAVTDTLGKIIAHRK